MFVVDLTCPVLCAIVYRPPKINKYFLPEFSELLSDLIIKAEKLLICGDFNIHVCCETNQLATEFKSLFDSFGLTQSVTSPTHDHGHTLDLIISHGLSISLREIVDIGISDHFPILFDFSDPPPVSKPVSLARRRRIFITTTAGEFTAAFRDSQLSADAGLPPPPLCPDQLLSALRSTCSAILDSITPFKTKSSKTKTNPWLNDHTRRLRQQCRQAERQWKKDRLHVSLGWLRDSLAAYQRGLKEAKSKYLSSIINNSSHHPRLLFNTIDSVINPRPSVHLAPSTATCEEFVSFFTDKVASVRQSITNIDRSPEDVCAPPVLPTSLRQYLCRPSLNWLVA